MAEIIDNTGPSDREPNMWALIIPFLVFVAVMSFYPQFELSVDETDGTLVDPAKTQRYGMLVGVQVVLAGGLLFWFRQTIASQFPFRVSWLSVPVGVVGIVVWIGLSSLGWEHWLLERFGLAKSVARPSFDPFAQISSDTMRTLFLVARFCLLVVVVPIVEELFLRGWLIRYVENPKWWTVPLASIGTAGIVTATVYGMITHPGEAIAAAVWFSLVTWLMLKTGNFWDCVVAHAVTNLLLGIWIVWQGAWHLW